MKLDELGLTAKGFVRQPDGSWSKAVKSYTPRVRACEPKPVEGRSLVSRVQREETGGAGTPNRIARSPRFQITFTVFSTRPCDWDGYHIKPLQDMLVHAGLLPGDAWDRLEGSIRSKKVHAKDEERTQVEIYER